MNAAVVPHHPQAIPATLETAQRKMDGFFSQLPFTCYLPEVASVGDQPKICRLVASRVGTLCAARREVSGGCGPRTEKEGLREQRNVTFYLQCSSRCSKHEKGFYSRTKVLGTKK